jgi:hypothetical protein
MVRQSFSERIITLAFLVCLVLSFIMMKTRP